MGSFKLVQVLSWPVENRSLAYTHLHAFDHPCDLRNSFDPNSQSLFQAQWTPIGKEKKSPFSCHAPGIWVRQNIHFAPPPYKKIRIHTTYIYRYSIALTVVKLWLWSRKKVGMSRVNGFIRSCNIDIIRGIVRIFLALPRPILRLTLSEKTHLQRG